MSDIDVRETVLTHIALEMYKAEKLGLDGYATAERLFPGTPMEVLAMAYGRVGRIVAEEWWQMVEDTIDGDAIMKAVALVEGKLKSIERVSSHGSPVSAGE